MNFSSKEYITFSIVAVLLLLSELAYFRIADKFNIIDKPNQRSSHTIPTIRGGGIIFLLAVLLFSVLNKVLLFGMIKSGICKLANPVAKHNFFDESLSDIKYGKFDIGYR